MKLNTILFKWLFILFTTVTISSCSEDKKDSGSNTINIESKKLQEKKIKDSESSSEKIKYTSTGIHYISYESMGSNNVTSMKPAGKDVTLEYDPFFKNWKITYRDEKNVSYKMSLILLADKFDYLLMRDNEGHEFHVLNEIKTQQVLILNLPDKPGAILFAGIKLENE